MKIQLSRPADRKPLPTDEVLTNPYAPPGIAIDECEHDGRLTAPVIVELTMDANYLTDAVERSRIRDPIRRLWMMTRWPCAALLFLTAGVLAFNAMFYYALGLVAFTVGSFFAYRIDDMFYMWSLKRSGWLNERCCISMSDAGYRFASRGFDMTVPWSSFRRADIFEDGLLFFQTPRSSPWIPWSAVSAATDRDRLMAFVRKTFAANHVMHRSGGRSVS